jgi:hypothetical protein
MQANNNSVLLFIRYSLGVISLDWVKKISHYFLQNKNCLNDSGFLHQIIWQTYICGLSLNNDYNINMQCETQRIFENEDVKVSPPTISKNF